MAAPLFRPDAARHPVPKLLHDRDGVLARGEALFAGRVSAWQVVLAQHLVANRRDDAELGRRIVDFRQHERPQVLEQLVLRRDRAENPILIARVHAGSSRGHGAESITPSPQEAA